MDYHPFIVHFPVALLTVGFFCDAAGVLFRRDHLLRTGYLLLVLGAVSAIAAALTGNAAEDAAARIPGIAAALEQHESFSTAATWLAIGLALFRTHLTVRRKFAGNLRFVYLAGRGRNGCSRCHQRVHGGANELRIRAGYQACDGNPGPRPPSCR